MAPKPKCKDCPLWRFGDTGPTRCQLAQKHMLPTDECRVPIVSMDYAAGRFYQMAEELRQCREQEAANADH